MVKYLFYILFASNIFEVFSLDLQVNSIGQDITIKDNFLDNLPIEILVRIMQYVLKDLDIKHNSFYFLNKSLAAKIIYNYPLDYPVLTREDVAIVFQSPAMAVVVKDLCLTDPNFIKIKELEKLFLYKKSIQDLKFLLLVGVNVNCQDCYGITSLMVACFNEDLEKIVFLLLKKANVNHYTRKNNFALNKMAAPLFCAINSDFSTEEHSLVIVKILLLYKANVNMRDNLGRTPLMYAAFRAFERVSDYLLVHGANINAQDNEGYTPLSYSLLDGLNGLFEDNIIDFLLKKGADPNISNYSTHQTPIILALKNNKMAQVKILLRAKLISLDTQDDLGNTVLMYALHKDFKIFNKILKKIDRSQLFIKNKKEETLLDLALEAGNENIINLVREYMLK